MTAKRFVQDIVRIGFSVVMLVLLHNFIAAHEDLPMLIFWICAEVVAFMDGVIVYNMVWNFRNDSAQTVSELSSDTGSRYAAEPVADRDRRHAAEPAADTDCRYIPDSAADSAEISAPLTADESDEPIYMIYAA